jgi:glycosyltransferase involved in cell wall biosynthesis
MPPQPPSTSGIARRLADARWLAKRNFKILARQLRIPPGAPARREFARQRVDYLAVAEQLSAAPMPLVVVAVGSVTDQLRSLLDALLHHTSWPYQLLLIAPRSLQGSLRDMLDERPDLACAAVDWADAPLDRKRMVRRARELAGDVDLVLLQASAEIGSGWLKRLRLAAHARSERGAPASDEAAAGAAILYVRQGEQAAVPPPSAEASARLPRALFVIATRTGGTPQTNQDLMQALAGRYETFLLQSDAKSLTLERFTDGRYEIVRQVRLPERLQPFPHTDPKYDRIVAGWLAEHAFDLLHIRHIGWHSLSLPGIARVFGIPVVFSFHDFYTICPTVRLVDENDVFCGGTCTATPGDCRSGLWKPRNFPALKNAAVHPWRANMAKALALCDAFVTTSESTRERIRKFFPVTTEKAFRVIEHGRDFPGFERLGRFPELGERVRVLMPGNISVTKGSRILQRMQALNGDGRFEFHLMGSYDRELRRTPNLVLHGLYERDRFADTVRAVAPHLGLILSIWPETFCHTLTEMWAVGLPIAAFDLGAVGDRLRRHGGGWLTDEISAPAAFRMLEAAIADRQAFEARIAEVLAWQAGAGATETCARMAEAHLDLYAELRRGRPPICGPFS